MEIRTLHATFGRLAEQELHLEPGLNLIEAPNESGKSTWAAFLRAMLYGISTSERGAKGRLPDKQRYLPWSGAPMSGSMDLIWRGQALTLTRSSTGRGRPMGAAYAVYTGTGEKVPELMKGVPGETLLGVTEAVYRRSAFISGAALALDADSELEKRITALVTGGEEDYSYSEAEERLRRWLRKRRWRNSGRIPEAEAEAARVQTALRSIELESGRLAELRQEQERLTEQKTLLEEEMKRHRRDAYAAAQQRRAQAAEAETALAEARTQAQAAEAAAEGLRQADADALRTAGARLPGAAAASARASEALREAHEALSALPDPEAVPQTGRGGFLALLLAGGLLLAAGLAQAILTPLPLPVYAGWSAAALGAASAALAFVLRGRRRRAEAEERARRSEAQTAAREALNAREAEQSAASAAEAALRTELAALRKALRAGESEPDAALLARVERLLADCAAARQALAAAESLAAALRELPGEADAAPPEPVEGEVRLSRSETESALQRTDARLRDAARELHRGEGMYAVLGDPLVLATRERRLQEELRGLERECAALELASEALREANARLQTLFSPIVSREAAALLGRMTEGAYRGVYFDRELRFSAQRTDEGAVRELGYLSEGTQSQLYLSVRLAICRLLLSGEEPCPIVLDDVLATFDDVRARQTLRLLRELAQERQILLFTCRSRERELLRELEQEETPCPQP